MPSVKTELVSLTLNLDNNEDRKDFDDGESTTLVLEPGVTTRDSDLGHWDLVRFLSQSVALA